MLTGKCNPISNLRKLQKHNLKATEKLIKTTRKIMYMAPVGLLVLPILI